MHVTLSTDVAGVAPAEALAWWSDFREGGHDHGFIPGAQRRIVARGPSFASMEESTKWLGVRVFRERVTATVGDREVRFTGENDHARFTGAYRFETAGTGTRIVLDADIRLKPALRWTDVVAKPIVMAILRFDLRGHAKDLRRDLRGTRQNPRQRRT